MNFSCSLSTDAAFCQISVEQTPGTKTVVTAHQLEQLIDRLASVRAQMGPLVDQCQSPLSQSVPAIDGESPLMDFAAVEGSCPLVLLGIAFRHLGWRTVSLTPREAGELGMKLLTLSATR